MKKIVLVLIVLSEIFGALLITPIVSHSMIMKVSESGQIFQEAGGAADPEDLEPVYVGIAQYYDNRKAVVTSTNDDLVYNTSAWQNCLSMLTEKKIYHTVGIITNHSKLDNDWNFVQYWVDQGYTEAGSHSRNHVHVPYTGTEGEKNKVSYEWQINGSKNDIIGNLTLPDWWRSGEKEYVYAWIEPYGSSDTTVRQWLGDCYYLSDRRVSSGSYSFAWWDSANELFYRVGYTVEMGTPPWGGGDSSVSSLNSKFDFAYNNGKIYHLVTHPIHVDWREGGYADQHTDYISNRKDVWYVPFGLLYLYHWVDVRNVIDVTSTGYGQDKIFKIEINETDHENYGVSYPITYVFNIPSNWTDAFVYYRYRETDPWILMANKSSEDFFNGINASRLNFSDNKAYVSVGFSNVSHEIHLQLRTQEMMVHDVAIDSITPSATKVYIGQNINITVIVLNEGNFTETFNVTVYANTTAIQTQNVFNLAPSTMKNLTFSWNTTGVTPCFNYTLRAEASVVPGEIDTIDNTFIDGIVHVKIQGDVNGDGNVDITDLALVDEVYGKVEGDPNYNPDADLNYDEVIDIYDLAEFGRNYGTIC